MWLHRVSQLSTGVGMGPLSSTLTPLQRVQLAHVRGGHRSLQAMLLDQRNCIGMPQLTTAALKEFAQHGCDLCNAYKLKLYRPSGKAVDEQADEDASP